jgi:PadR family transcriptional regulator, regulatory protein PadR
MLPSEGLKPIERLSTHFPPAVPILINWSVGCHRQNAEQMRTSAFPGNPVQGPMPQPADLLQGTLDMLILRAIANEPQHGWAIAQRIQQVSNNVLQVGQGSLYPALHRLEYKGWIRAQWGSSENNRKARFYSLSAAGRKRLNVELENWNRLSGAVNLVLEGI